MAKIIDITDKLEMGGNPSLLISGKKLEVNGDAATMFLLIGKCNNMENMSVNDMLEIYNIIFPEESRKVISDMKLQFADLETVIQEAIGLITGGDEEEPGEQ